MDPKQAQIDALKAQIAALEAPPAAEPFRLDLGCGKNKKEGFKGVDIRKWDTVDFVIDIANEPWPWADGSVDEVHCSHTIEHFTWPQRVHFFNELGRVLKKGAKATLIWPHWCADRYWGDPTHQQPMSPFGLFYLNAEWRKTNAPHCDYAQNEGDHQWHEYTCDFDNVVSYSLAPWMNGRSQDFLQFAMAAYKEAAQDIMATLTKR